MSIAAALTDRVHDYHVAREAQELRLEAAAGTRERGEDCDASRFYAQTGAADQGGEQPLTWKRWLQQTSAPAPSPDEIAAIDLAAAWAAHDAADAAKDAYELACKVRAETFAGLIADGWTYQRLADALGVSRAAVHQVVARANKPTTIEGE